MGPALLLIAQLYRVEKQARLLPSEERLRLRQLQSRPILDKLRDYLLEIQAEVLPKSPEGRAVRYTLKNWTALNRFCEDGDLEIDNNATERAIRGVAVGRHNWMFFGSDNGGKTAAVLRSFVASCRTGGYRSFCLVQRRSLSHRHPSHHPVGRTSAAQLGSQSGLIPTRSKITAMSRLGDSQALTLTSPKETRVRSKLKRRNNIAQAGQPNISHSRPTTDPARNHTHRPLPVAGD